MKLTRLECRILKYISQAFPHPFDPVEAKEIKTAEERPLATEAMILDTFKTESAESVKQGIVRLKAYRCIESIYLYAADDFREQYMSPGHKIRHIPLKKGNGQDGFQVTQFGLEITQKSFGAWAKRTFLTSFSKFFEEKAVFILVFLLGMLIASVFGFDIKELFK